MVGSAVAELLVTSPTCPKKEAARLQGDKRAARVAAGGSQARPRGHVQGATDIAPAQPGTTPGFFSQDWTGARRVGDPADMKAAFRFCRPSLRPGVFGIMRRALTGGAALLHFRHAQATQGQRGNGELHRRTRVTKNLQKTVCTCQKKAPHQGVTFDSCLCVARSIVIRPVFGSKKGIRAIPHTHASRCSDGIYV